VSELTILVDKPQPIRLSDCPTQAFNGHTKAESTPKLDALGEEMEELLDLLFSAGQHSLLIVLQGMDTSGKDGTIRHILTHSNAQSLKVWPFKVPTPIELSHDFLWRVHQVCPGRGSIAVFNRSHYEDVLVVRVHDLVPEKVWSRRYEQINAFEELLAEHNTIILKFFLHITKEEQEQRLLDREKEVEKAWKLAVADWKEREHWDAYQEAYEAAIGRCSSEEAPWHIVPSDQKWYRNLAITRAIVEALKPYRKGWMEKLEMVGEKAKAELAAMRQGQ
jgi:PPK2 family polyphosphate:nucleotide phosphotransferase